MIFFALPFIAIGAGMATLGGWTALKVRQSQSWTEVPAMIRTVELKGDETRRIAATYDYDFQGRVHTGERVSFHIGSDSLGRFHDKAFTELQGFQQARKPFRCFANPSDPSESVLYRDVRWEMMLMYSGIAILFGGTGIGLFTASIVTWRRRRDTAMEATIDSNPWSIRSDWASGKLGTSDTTRAKAPAALAVAIWCALASLPVVATLSLVSKEADSRWWLLLFAIPAIAILAGWCAAYLTIRQRKFGESTFEMASVPGVIGGALSGVIRISTHLQPERGFRLNLFCMSQEENKKGDRRHETVLWKEEHFVAEALSGSDLEGLAIPVLIEIPFSAQETTPPDARNRIRWLLEISAELPGINYQAEFEVPVLKTADSREDFKLDASLATDYSSAPNNDLLLREAGLIKEPASDGGMQIVFPAGRSLGTAILMAMFAVALWIGAWFTLQKGSIIIFSIMCALFGLLLTYIAIESLFYSSVVVASRYGLRIRGGLLRIGRDRNYELNELKQFTSTQSMASGKNIWCTLSVQTTSDGHRTIGKGISSKLVERALVDELNSALGIELPLVAGETKSLGQK